MRETVWGWFTEREMNEIDMTTAEAAKADAKWAEITEAAKAHGGLKAYGEYLLAEAAFADREFATACEAVLPLLPTFKSDRFPDGFLKWEVHGRTVVGINPYGCEGATAGFDSIRRLMKKGKTLVQAIAWHA